ncbi:MAG TPA: hypothetical protein VF933_28185 [Streptosporangiaceae bacterium]
MHIWRVGTGRGGQHLCFRTTCGRRISVGLLALGDIQHPAQRVSLDIGPSSGTGDGTWAGLTAGEARQLAAALLSQVTAVEHNGESHGSGSNHRTGV